jgi:outer membrane lipoprotein-sorting protein
MGDLSWVILCLNERQLLGEKAMLKSVSTIGFALIAAMATAGAQTIPVANSASGKDAGFKLAAAQGPISSASPAQHAVSQEALVERISSYLSNMKTLVGDFVQVGPDGRRTEGQFYVQKPGKVRFEYTPPSRVDVIADGQSVVVRDRMRATQDVYPLSQTPLRFLVADRVDLARDTHLVSVGADDQFVTVVIEEQQVVGTNRLMLKFGAKDLKLRQWTVTDPQGYDTTVAVYNLDTGKKLDPALFKISYENPDSQNAR